MEERCSPVRISAVRDTAGCLTGVRHTIVPSIVPSLLVALMRCWRVAGVAPSVVMLLLLMLMLLMLLLCRVSFMMSRSGSGSCGTGRSVGRVDLSSGVSGAGVDARRGVDLPGGRTTSRGAGLLGLVRLVVVRSVVRLPGGWAHFVRPVQA